MTVGGWGEWLKNMRSNGEKPFKMTRENNRRAHCSKMLSHLFARCWCIPIDTDVMDGNKWATSDLARIKYINIHKARGYTNGQPDLVVLMPSGRTLLGGN